MTKDTECKERIKKKNLLPALRREQGLGKRSWNCVEEEVSRDKVQKEEIRFCHG